MEICPGDSKPCWVMEDDDGSGHWRCGTVQCGQKALHGFVPAVDPTPETEDAAIVELRTQIVGWLRAMSAEGTEPMVAAGMLFETIKQMCEPAMGKGAIRTALLMTFEKTYDQPMSFIERNEAKDLLDALSNMRRKVEGKPHLILPGGSHDA